MDVLRERWPAFLFLLLLVLGLNPSPIPTPLVDSLQAARVALEAGRAEPALANIHAAITFEPALQRLHWKAAKVALAGGNPQLALSHLDLLPHGSTPDFEQACLRSRAHLALDEVEAAVHIRHDMDERCPDEAEYLQELAQRQLNMGDFEQALGSLEALTLLEPSAGSPRLQLGLVTSVLQPEQSLTHLRLAEELAPRSDPLARALIQTIEDAQAFNDPAYTLAQVGQTLARAENWMFAARAFKQALELDPEYAEVRAYYGLALDKLGQDGADPLRQAVQDAPEAALPRVFLALHHIDRGNFSLAKEQLEKAAELDPANPAIAAELGAAYSAVGDVRAAKAAYRRAASLAPEQPEFWQLLAQFALGREMELNTLAIPAARNAASLDSGQAAALDVLGYAHLLAGNSLLAERLLLQSYRIEPARPQTLLHLGQMRLMQGEIQMARRSLQLAVALDPQGPAGQTAQRTLDGLSP
jgi:tetratricopeptide (TPR) repeat protein